MVNYIDIHSLTLDELSGVVSLYPWYGAARVELCRRMSSLDDGWGREQFAAEALYIPDRGKLAPLLRTASPADCADKDIERLLASLMAPPVEEQAAPEIHSVHVVGGDYFSQAQYKDVGRADDNIFTRFAVKVKSDAAKDERTGNDIADRYATETLAEIFAEQGCVEEARRIYSRLILENPEKSAYFATLIDKLS